MATKKDKPSAPDYIATRTETFTLEGQDYRLVVGNVYAAKDLPESLIADLVGGYGGLEEVPAGALEVQAEDGSWTVEEEADADA